MTKAIPSDHMGEKKEKNRKNNLKSDDKILHPRTSNHVYWINLFEGCIDASNSCSLVWVGYNHSILK